MVKWKRIFKKTIAMVSTVAMLATMTDWSKVSAAAQEAEFRITENVTLSEEEAEADNDELFAGYVQKAFLGDSGISLFSTENHTKNLNTDEKSIYAALKTEVAKIAAGTRASTEITLNVWEKTFTYAELSLDASADGAAVEAAVKTAFTNNISISKILRCLMADCPYEMYWYDKTVGTSYSYRISADGSQCTLSSLCFEMTVASAYASGTYTTDTTITGATSTAVANARAIVTENAGKSDYEKLVAYRDKICELVSYNEEAANNADTPYGDPWQLIYAFDNNPDTNIVCEGYSKAFQYLCELSTFSGDVICYTVSGGIPGAHMWNHVTIGGKNYLVDVTNCDEGTIGAPDKLFLKGMTGSISDGYTKTLSKTITYTFKDETKEMFGTGADSVLNLSADDYVETVDAVQSVSASSSVSSLTWRYATGATLTATPTLAIGELGTPTYQWYKVSDGTETVISGATNATYTMESGLLVGTYTYRVYASIGECKKSADVSVTINPLKLTASDLEFTSDTITKVYDGTTSSTATVQIKAGVVDTNAVSVAGTAAYNNENVKNATKVIFTPTAITSGNYTLAATETIEHPATITKKTGTAAPAAPTATTANIKDTEITLTAVTDCEYSQDGMNWQDSPKFTGLTPNTLYTFYQRIKDSDNVEASASSSADIKTLQTSLNDAVLTLTLPQGGYTYDGTEKKPSVEVKLNGVTVDSSQYTVDYTSNKNAGTGAKVTVTANTSGQYSGSVEKTFTINKLVVTPSIEGSTSKTYDGKTTCAGAGLAIKLANVILGDDVTATATTYTYDSETAGTNKTITASNITLSGTTSSNYELSSTTAQAAVGTVEKAQATITANPIAYSKVYKDADFALSDVSYTGDGTLTYTVTDSKYLSTDGNGNPSEQSVDNDKVITVSADGKVTIVGSGSAKIKITATEGTNYNAVGDANAKSITVTVAKAANPPYKPDAALSANIDCTTVSDVTLSGDWQWTAETASIRFDSVAEGSPVAATAVYQGADAKHYETISVDVAITRANHNHVAGQVVFTGEGEKAPTCTEAGIGHIECTADGCGKTIESNIPAEPLGHNLTAVQKKDATCTEEGLAAHWKCSRCGKIFADKDGNTETTLEALKISATGHQWKTEYTIDKAATETEAGSKSIHCVHCDTIKPGSSVEIPKKDSGAGNGSGSGGESGSGSGSGAGGGSGSGGGGGAGGGGGTPTKPTEKPTVAPTAAPSEAPSTVPTAAPSEAPSIVPTAAPSASAEPTKNPVTDITPKPTKAPDKGSKIKDTKNVYVVTKISKTVKTVEYTKPKNKNITSVSIPKTVKINGVSYKITTISTNAFNGCKKLKSVTIGNNIVKIGKNAFKNCKNLKKINIQSTKLTLKNIGKDAFKGMNKKAVITVPAKKYQSYKKLLRKSGVPASVKIKKNNGLSH